MEQLPFIDEHAREIRVSPERVWSALLLTLRSMAPKLPRWLTAAWGLQQPARSGDWWPRVTAGDTLPGFTAAEVKPSRVLALRGRHRFSEYELRFELEELTAGATRLHAKSWAAFPGHKGHFYRAVVVGTGGHRIAVRRILARVARRAERAGDKGPQPPQEAP